MTILGRVVHRGTAEAVPCRQTNLRQLAGIRIGLTGVKALIHADGCAPEIVSPTAFQWRAVEAKYGRSFQGGTVFRRTLLASIFFACLTFAPAGRHVIAEEQPLYGFSAESSQTERQWEEKLRAIPSPENLRA